MRNRFLSILFGGLLFVVGHSSADAQPPPPPPSSQPPPAQPPPTQPPIAQAPTPTPAPTPQPVAETKKPERDDSSATIPYFLAGISVTIVLLLVCLPARRE